VSVIRRLRVQAGCSQAQFADLLGVSPDTYRVWDSGRRQPPPSIITMARRLCDTECGRLLPLARLAAEYGIHVRTLRHAAQDGRLSARFSARMAFGKLVAFASRDAVEQFQRRFYRRNTRWTPRPASPIARVPDDYDRVLVQLRATWRLSQAALAAHVGAANKAVVYQWESRRRRPSPLLWMRVEALRTSQPSSPGTGVVDAPVTQFPAARPLNSESTDLPQVRS
jgi:DNA-binding transcriptional regulator YiaG